MEGAVQYETAGDVDHILTNGNGIVFVDFIKLIMRDSRWEWSNRWWTSGSVIASTNGSTWEEKSPNHRVPINIDHLGCGGHDQNGDLIWIGWDLDVGHGNNPYATIDEAIDDAMRLREALGEAEIRRSKSGRGIHVRHLLPEDSNLKKANAAKIVKFIAKKFNLRADVSNLGRQAFWCWSRNPAQHAYEEITEQTKPVLDLADIIVEALAACTAPIACEHGSRDFTPYDQKDDDDSIEDRAIALWEPGPAVGRSPFGERNWGDIRHFAWDFGMSISRAIELIRGHGVNEIASPGAWPRMFKYTRYPRGWRRKDFQKFTVVTQAEEIAAGEPVAASIPTPASKAEPPAKSSNQWPIEILIPSVRAIVSESAWSAQAPVDLPAQMALGVLSALCARRVQVEWQAGKTEPTNLYLLTALPPSERKSTIVNSVVTPLAKYEKEAREAQRQPIARWRAARKLIEKKIEAKQTAITKNKASYSEVQSLVDELCAHEETEPLDPRFIVDDITPEALNTLLMKNGSLALISAEGNLIDNISGRYSKNGDPAFTTYLKAWSGDMIAIDRASGRSETIERPILTIAVTTQPSSLAKLASLKNSRGSGLISRFLFSIPSSCVGVRMIDTPGISPTAAENWERLVRRLAEMKMTTLRLEADAKSALLAFAGEIEKRIGPGGDLARIADWGGKVEIGQVVRIAGVLHCCEHASPGEALISSATMWRALALTRYFIRHARTAFDTMASENADMVQKIAAWIRDEALSEISLRAVMRKFHLSKAEALPVLAEMENLDYAERKNKGTWSVVANLPKSTPTEAVTPFESPIEPEPSSGKTSDSSAGFDNSFESAEVDDIQNGRDFIGGPLDI